MQYFIVGSGLWGSVMAERIASQLNEKVTVFEKRNHTGGNSHSSIDEETGIECHRYGSHIFHTSLPEVYEYINKFVTLNNYHHRIPVMHNGKVYSMPINLATINNFYNRTMTPTEAGEFLAKEIERDRVENPANLEEKAISLIGRPLYDAFIKNYTRKQWNKDPKELPAGIITRLPFRTSYNDNHFSDLWQGIPVEGYCGLFERLLSHPNITVELNTDYRDVKDKLPRDAKIIYTGMPDELFDCKYGPLAWRSLDFEWETAPVRDYQGCAVMNFTDANPPYTRIHEFKHYHPERTEPFNQDKTVICREYPRDYAKGKEAYYPVNDEVNNDIYARYRAEAEKNPNLILGGRLASYRYWDMDKAINDALQSFKENFAR